ncbi:N-acetylglucosamine-6-phosphate deacetylase-like isoform X2 [Pollicipes pollicipes]|uniref:N-acetylglucosamine-6-phosphate deacetylase-like isoform X2 n=1 Tax=Pollicipes pollicipes TaxID=41117 RepID=UPI00188579BF|nr:N-acetylglucosamine-6-phosphate deacetylase-like isoform X2 [Pollicipes pollicipes]
MACCVVQSPAIRVTMSGVTQFKNCRILYNHRLIREDLWVEDGLIINPEELFYKQKRPPTFQVDCKDSIVAPGFIDVQINGGFGFDFAFDEDKTEDAVSTVARGILAHGVTSFLPTVITSAPSVYRKVLPLLRKQPGGEWGAGVLGAHLEGPFISKEKKGAHPVQHIREFDEGFVTLKDVYGCLDNVAMVTLAPELPNALDAVRGLVDRGIVVSVGHSAGSIVDGERAFECGAHFMTHLFNAMTKFHHRDPGIIGMLTSKRLPVQELSYGIISDGIHTHPAALRIAYKTHPTGLCLVTDAVSAMGLGSGRHHIGDMDVEIQGERAVIAGTDTLCGSIVTMDGCIRHYMHSARCSTVEALEAASLHPARALGIVDKKGTLEFGSDADFVLLSDDVHVRATYISGRPVFTADGQQFLHAPVL